MHIAEQSVPKLALGTWLMGGTKDPDPHNDDDGDIAVIRLAIEEGITLIDTAQNYAGGKCEEIIAQAVKKYPRDTYQILTKQNKFALSYDKVIRGCHDSMTRLGVSYLDYFVCHAPNKDFDMGDFFKAANKLHKDGLIRNIGVSNFGPGMLELALKLSDVPIRLNQVHFSLSDDDALSTGTYDFCVKNGITIQAYRTLASLGENPAAASVLTSIAATNNITLHQAAIAYLNSYKNIAFTIRASSKTHWDQIKAALKIKLKDQDIERLRKTHQDLPGPYRNFLLL